MQALRSVKNVLVHIIGVISFLIVSIRLNYSPDFWNGIYRDLFGYLMMVVFFYYNYYFLLPKFYFKEKYLLLGMVMLSSFIFIVLIPHLIFPFEIPEGLVPPPPALKEISPFLEHTTHNFVFHAIVRQVSHNFFLFFVVVFVSISLRVNSQLKKTQHEKLITELSYLKAQVNPHFLFNTLNSIYSLAIQKRSNDTAQSVVKLSGMMRYVLHDTTQDFVSLEKELEYISDFIDLQKMRWEDKINIDFSISGNPHNWNVAPVILQPFIENAIKYGINPDAPYSSVVIDINIDEEKLTLWVKNTIVRKQKGLMNERGIGMKNTTRRLEILYPQEHTLVKKETAQEYSIMLTLAKK